MVKITPQLFGIVALAGLVVSAIGNEQTPEVLESPFQLTVRRLRTGMSLEEVRSAIQIPTRCAISLSGQARYLTEFYFDRGHREFLILSFQDKARAVELTLPPRESVSPMPPPDFRLVRWELKR